MVLMPIYAAMGTCRLSGHATPPGATKWNTPYTLDDGDPGGISSKSGPMMAGSVARVMLAVLMPMALSAATNANPFVAGAKMSAKASAIRCASLFCGCEMTTPTPVFQGLSYADAWMNVAYMPVDMLSMRLNAVMNAVCGLCMALHSAYGYPYSTIVSVSLARHVPSGGGDGDGGGGLIPGGGGLGRGGGGGLGRGGGGGLGRGGGGGLGRGGGGGLGRGGGGGEGLGGTGGRGGGTQAHICQ